MVVINSEKAPKAIGPYSQGIRHGQLVFTSGQLPLVVEDGSIPENIKDQAKQCCENIKAILEEAGSSLEKVIKATCYLSDMSYFGDFNEVYKQYFISCPARTCVAVKELPMAAKCEIEVVASV